MAAVKYKLIKNFFTKEELNVYQKYCYNKLDVNKDYVMDDTHSFSPSWHDDPLMNVILDTKLPLVEKESNLKLFPIYHHDNFAPPASKEHQEAMVQGQSNRGEAISGMIPGTDADIREVE